MGIEVWLPLQFTEAGRVPYFMWWLSTSRSCVFLPPTLPFFCSVSLEWKQFLFLFYVCYFFWDFSSNSPALEKGYLPEGVSLEVALHIWEADGRAVPFILQLLTLNQRMQYQFSAGSVVGAAVLVQSQPSPGMNACEVLGDRHVPAVPSLWDVYWVTVFLSLLNMSKSLIQSCDA